MFFFFVFFSMQSKYHVVASQSILDYAHLKMKKAKYSLQGKGKRMKCCIIEKINILQLEESLSPQHFIW